MLVPGIVPVNQMRLTVECFKVGQHERRNEIAAMDQQFGPFLIGSENSPPEMRDVVMTIRKNSDAHEDRGIELVWLHASPAQKRRGGRQRNNEQSVPL